MNLPNPLPSQLLPLKAMSIFQRVIFLVTTVLLVAACGLGGSGSQSEDSNPNRGGGSTITFELPDGVSEVTDYEPTVVGRSRSRTTRLTLRLLFA